MTRPDLDAIDAKIHKAAELRSVQQVERLAQGKSPGTPGLFIPERDLVELLAYARELEQTSLPSVQAWGKFKAAERRINALEQALEPICRTIIDPLVTDAKRVLESRLSERSTNTKANHNPKDTK